MQVFDPRKLAELSILFTKYNQHDRLFGMTKLNMLLWVADFLAFGYMGKSITGATYVHQPQGPAPDPAQFGLIQEGLIRSGRLRIEEEETYLGIKKQPRTDSEPDLSLFTDAELDLCWDTLENLRRMSSAEANIWSRSFPGWLYTTEGEEIPYSTVYLWERRPATKEDLVWGSSVAAALGILDPA
jgi:hypothetical protein